MLRNLLQNLLESDVRLFWFVNLQATSPVYDGIMQTLSSAWIWWLLASLTLLWGILKKNRRLLKTLLLIAIAMGISDVFSFEVLKPGIGRERPCRDLDGVRLVESHCGGDYGFPSNHAANGFAAATVIWLRRPRIKSSKRFLFGLPFLLAGVVGFTRIYLGVHFPLDVLGGFFVGACIGIGLLRFIRNWALAALFFEPKPQA